MKKTRMQLIAFNLFLYFISPVYGLLDSEVSLADEDIINFVPAILAGVKTREECQSNCADRRGGYQVPFGLEQGASECILRTNIKYYPLPPPHTYDLKAYFELCGNYHVSVPEPYHVLPEKESYDDRYLTLWMEVNAPFNQDGTVWFDSVCLVVGDSDENHAPNSAFCINMDDDGWDSKENIIEQQYPEHEVCKRGISDYANCNTMEGFVNDEHSPSHRSLRVDVKSGYRYHTYIDYKHFVDLNNYPIGTKIKASVYVRINGDVQVRLGMDFRKAIEDGLPQKMVNGKIIQLNADGSYSMDRTLLTLP